MALLAVTPCSGLRLAAALLNNGPFSTLLVVSKLSDLGHYWHERPVNVDQSRITINKVLNGPLWRYWPLLTLLAVKAVKDRVRDAECGH